MSKNVLENPKLKVVRNDRGKVWTSPERAHGLPTKPQDTNRAIYGRHRQCRWCGSWANLLHFESNLEMPNERPSTSKKFSAPHVKYM